MSQENLETIRYLFQAVENRDVAGVLAAYAPEIVSAMLHHCPMEASITV